MKNTRKKQDIICPKCSDTGYINFVRDGITYSRPCECLEKRLSMFHYKSMNIPKSFMDKDIDSFIISNKSQQTAVSAIRDYIGKFPDISYGLLFMGPAGTGKTHLAVSVFKAIRTRTRDRMLFMDASSLLNNIKHSIGDRYSDESSTPDIIRDVSSIPILLLDDLGSQKVSMWTQDIIKIIISHRYNNNLLTFITTPYEDRPKSPEKEKLEQRIGEINRSRLYEMCRIINLEGEDFRKMMINPRLL